MPSTNRQMALQHYSPTDPPSCACPGCGATTDLELNHAHSGNRHRRLLKHRALADVLAAEDYPPYVLIDGTLSAITVLCHACNHSKGAGPSCRLSHGVPMRHENTQDSQADTPTYETAQHIIKRRSSELRQRVSHPPTGNPQVRLRIDPTVWAEIEAEATKQKQAPGEFLEGLFRQTIHERFRALEDQLRVLKLQQDQILTQLDALLRVQDSVQTRAAIVATPPMPHVDEIPPVASKVPWWQRKG